MQYILSVPHEIDILILDNVYKNAFCHKEDASPIQRHRV